MVDVDGEGRERRAVYLPASCWAWLEETAAHDRSSRSDILEGLVLLAMDGDVVRLDQRAVRDGELVARALRFTAGGWTDGGTEIEEFTEAEAKRMVRLAEHLEVRHTDG